MNVCNSDEYLQEQQQTSRSPTKSFSNIAPSQATPTADCLFSQKVRERERECLTRAREQHKPEEFYSKPAISAYTGEIYKYISMFVCMYVYITFAKFP